MAFQGVRYHLPSCVPREKHGELTRVLTGNDAERSDSIFDATHIITTSHTFEGWQDVDKSKVAIVSDLWVERSLAAGKQQPVAYYSTSPSQIFSGVVACSADLAVSDVEVLTVGIQTLGGQWRMGLTKDVTHLFALGNNTDRYQTGMDYRDQTHIKVLVPHWFDDSIRLGGGVDTAPYEWPNPMVLQKEKEDEASMRAKKARQRNSMSPAKKALYKTASWDPQSQEAPPMFEAKDVWGGRRILVSTTLELKGSRRKLVEGWIRKAQGVVVTYTHNDGDGDYGEELRNLKNQILHFPTKKGGVEGFEKQSISVTNYAGEARDYLKKLITLMGGEFTPSFSSKNSVLVAAHMGGSKTTKAREWSIAVVNHSWLEDCFIQWRNLTTALDKYILYPLGSISRLCSASEAWEALAEGGNYDDSDEEAEEPVTDDATAVGGDGAVSDAPIGSQSSADESEVQDRLMPPPLDVDVKIDVDEPEPGRWRSTPPRPATPKSAPASTSKRRSPKKRIEGLSQWPSDSEVDPVLAKKVVYVKRPMSAAKFTPKKKKARDTDSEESEKAESEVDNKPVTRRRLVHRVTGNVRSSPRKAAAEDSPAKRTGTIDKGKGKAKALSESEESDPESERKMPARKGGQKPSPNKFFPIILYSDSDSDLPVVLLPVKPKSPKAPPTAKGGIVKVTRDRVATKTRTPDPTPPSSPLSSPKAPAKGGIVKATCDRGLRDQTPPSSPLSSPRSPPKAVARTRMPTATVSVLMPGLRPSTKAPPARTQSMTLVAQERASGSGSASISAPWARAAAARSSSPASDAAGGRVRRSAAAKATQRLHDIMPDVVNFQNEMRNQSRKSRRVSGRTEPDDTGNEEDDTEEQPSTKRRRLDGAGKKVAEVPGLRNGKSIKLMTTQVTISEEDLRSLVKLGVKITSRASECTHLIVPGLVRTEKFLCALAAAPFILTHEWAVDSVAAGKLLPEDDYLLQDASGELKYDFALTDALARAKELKGRLFKDHMFYVTPKVRIDLQLLKNVVIAHGGQPSLRILETNPGRHVISCPEDARIWRPLAAVHPIYTQELVLNGVLKQQVDWDDESFRVPGSQ
ncbi:hypothetical protein B0H10DRAFT_2207120 [Mycena sp. CBHHK59/15]|nr:hypothetical protein B0H10DRAFT_2207120 [Mycena sp. CBHHK59/15]